MKIYISVDMEGMAGICSSRQEKDDTARFRKNYEQQVAWVIEGIQMSAKNDEIEEITISDSHGCGRNLSYDLTDLDDRISLIQGSPRPNYMMCGVEAGYDLVFLVGYHAGIGDMAGNMEHTFNGIAFYNVTVNGNYVNESTLSAAYAGQYDVPVALVIGDAGLRKQLIDDHMLPSVEFVSTKEPVNRMAAKHKSKSVVRKETIEAVQKVLAKDPKEFPVYKMEAPYTLEIEYTYRTMADAASAIPGTVQDGRTIRMNISEYGDVYDSLSAFSSIGMTAYPFGN